DRLLRLPEQDLVERDRALAELLDRPGVPCDPERDPFRAAGLVKADHNVADLRRADTAARQHEKGNFQRIDVASRRAAVVADMTRLRKRRRGDEVAGVT